MGAALAKQIPALIKGFLKVTKPPGDVADLVWVVLHLAAQLMLGVNHPTNAREEVGIIHTTQPTRDLR
jgi:hypothetical protein